MKSLNGFTIMELLVVISIIAILSAILFSTFSAAKRSSMRTDCASNLRQIGLAEGLYASNADDCLPVLNLSFAAASDPLASRTRQFSWMLAIEPYLQSDNVFICEEAPNSERIFTFRVSGKDYELPERHIGSNEWLNPDTFNGTYSGPVSSSSIAASRLPLLADSVYVDFDNPDYIVLADYESPGLAFDSGAFESDPNLAQDRKNPSLDRHAGGSNICFADTVQWRSQASMTVDPSRSNYPYDMQFLLPVNPRDNRLR